MPPRRTYCRIVLYVGILCCVNLYAQSSNTQPTSGQPASTQPTSTQPTSGQPQQNSSTPLNPSNPHKSSPLLGITAFSFSFSQSVSKDWALAEDNTFASRIAIKSLQDYNNIIGKLALRHNIVAKAGATYYDNSSEDVPPVRANDNELFAECQITYNLGLVANPYFASNFKTSITESFSVIRNKATRTASLWDPVSSQQSCGGAYSYTSPHMNLNCRLGFLFQQIRANKQTQQTDDPKTKEKERYKPSNGIEQITELIWKPDSSLSCNSKLTLQSTVSGLDVWYMKWETEMRVRVWKSLGVIFGLGVLQDTKQSLRTQIKQTLNFGLLL